MPTVQTLTLSPTSPPSSRQQGRGRKRASTAGEEDGTGGSDEDEGTGDVSADAVNPATTTDEDTQENEDTNKSFADSCLTLDPIPQRIAMAKAVWDDLVKHYSLHELVDIYEFGARYTRLLPCSGCHYGKRTLGDTEPQREETAQKKKVNDDSPTHQQPLQKYIPCTITAGISSEFNLRCRYE